MTDKLIELEAFKKELAKRKKLKSKEVVPQTLEQGLFQLIEVSRALVDHLLQAEKEIEELKTRQDATSKILYKLVGTLKNEK